MRVFQIVYILIISNLIYATSGGGTSSNNNITNATTTRTVTTSTKTKTHTGGGVAAMGGILGQNGWFYGDAGLMAAIFGAMLLL